MSWNINFNHYAADNVYSAVQRNKHLSGFSVAEEKLNILKNRLENLLFDAEWWGGKCKEKADHYSYMQDELRKNPDDFSAEHAREVAGQSPQKFYDYAAALNGGANRLRDALNEVSEILKKVEGASCDAKEDSKKVLDKIKQAIDLMDRYLRVNF